MLVVDIMICMHRYQVYQLIGLRHIGASSICILNRPLILGKKKEGNRSFKTTKEQDKRERLIAYPTRKHALDHQQPNSATRQ